jgi:hypothetical protein
MIRFSCNPSSWYASALAGLLALAACHTSPAPDVVALADSQRGAMVMLHMVDGSARTGELLAVRDSSLVLLRNRQVAVVPLSAVAIVDFGETRLSLERTPAAELLDRARRASRFPYGITPGAMAALLRSTGQEAPLELRPGAP